MACPRSGCAGAGVFMQPSSGFSQETLLECFASAHSLARQCGRERSLQSPPPTVNSLTSRERDVLRLICDGLSNKEIGLKLHIAETTARDHVHSLIRKLNTRNRTACAVEGIRRQLVHLSAPPAA